MGVKVKRGQHVFWYFSTQTYAEPYGKFSPRHLLDYMAEHWPILKNDQNTHFSLIFQDGLMLSHINGKLSLRPFE